MKKINLLLLFVFFTFYNCESNKAVSNSNKKIHLTEKPNFIFYLADDQDQLDYGCYGNPKVKTPHVDKLAKEGVRFNNFYANQAICAPARSQIFTGMYPVKNGCMANHLPVKPNILSVTSLLKDAGYEVVLAGKSHVNPSSVFNWTHRFKDIDHRYLPLDAIDAYLKNVKKPFCIFITSDFPHGPYPEVSNYSKEDIYRLPYNSAYVPSYKTGYYQNIEDDNEQLGKVLKMVDNYNLRNNSIFIYASDHGISGKWGLSEQGLKVPFIVRWPGFVKPNTTSNTLLSFVDVLPTFLDIAQVKIPNDIDGKSFFNTLKGSNENIHEYIYGVASRQNIQGCKVFPSRSIRDKKFKFIRNYNSFEVVDSNLGDNKAVNAFIKIGAESFPKVPYQELYNLSVDPYQKNNLIHKSAYKNETKRLSEALESWMQTQNDFLLRHKMPLIKPTLHPLDRASKWNKVPNKLLGTLKDSDYMEVHY